MTELTIQMIELSTVAGVAAVISSYVTMKVLAFRTRAKRRARHAALTDIASHQWDTGEHNDAVVITRIALRGLNGE